MSGDCQIRAVGHSLPTLDLGDRYESSTFYLVMLFDMLNSSGPISLVFPSSQRPAGHKMSVSQTLLSAWEERMARVTVESL